MPESSIASAFWSQNVGIIFVGAIAASLLGFIVLFVYKVAPMRREVRGALQLLKDNEKFRTPMTREMFHYLDTQMRRTEYLKEPWMEFAQALNVPDEPDEPVHNSLQAEKFFTKEHVIESHLNLELYAAVPGMMTALGLIGTFTAIYLALGELHVTDEQISNLGPFIGTLGAKFLASIAGLVAASVFLLAEKVMLGQLVSDYQQFLIQLNGLISQEPLDKVLRDMRSELRDFQVRSAAMATLHGHIVQHVEKLGLDVAELRGPGLAGLMRKAEEIRAATQEATDVQHERLKEMVSEVVIEFHRMLTQSANEEIGRLAKSIGHITAATEELQAMLSDVNQGFETALGVQKKQLQELLAYQETQNQKLLENEQARLAELVSSVEKHFSSIFQMSTVQLEKLSEQSEAWSKSQQDNMLVVLELSQDMLRKEHMALAQDLRALAAEYDATNRNTSRVAATELQRVLEGIEQFNARSLQTLQEEFGRISKVTAEWSGAVASDLGQVLSISAREAQNFKDAGNGLAAIVEAFKKSVDLNTSVIDGLGDTSESISRAAQALSTNDIAMRKVSAEQLAAMRRFEAQVEGYRSLLSTHTDLWEQQRESLVQLSQSLQSMVAALPAGEAQEAFPVIDV